MDTAVHSPHHAPPAYRRSGAWGKLDHQAGAGRTPTRFFENERRDMQQEVIINLTAGQELRIDLSHVQPMPNEEGRRWLDDQFTALDCEPLRASGKVLLADKVLVVARAAQSQLQSDAAWRETFGRAAAAVLQRPVIRVDVPGLAVSF